MRPLDVFVVRKLGVLFQPERGDGGGGADRQSRGRTPGRGERELSNVEQRDRVEVARWARPGTGDKTPVPLAGRRVISSTTGRG